MLTLTSFSRVALLTFFYFACSSAGVFAQGSTQYATSVVPTPVNVSSPAQAADQDENTSAVLQPGLVQAGAASERVQFATTIPADTAQSGLIIQVNNLTSDAANNVLSASFLNSVTISAYKDSTLVQSWSLNTLLGVRVLRAGQRKSLALSPAPSSDFNQLELAVDGTVNAYSVGFYEAYAPAAAVPLPVQLVSFQGRATPAGVQLSWTTASELRNSHFVVERASGSAGGTFGALGQVAGAGSSSQARSYQFTDPTPEALGYYRLRQVDADGRVTYSPVVAVRASGALTAYPNPATETLTVVAPAGTQLAIHNQQGQLLRQLTLGAGQPLDVRGLAVGLYFVRDVATGQRIRFEKTTLP